MAGQMSAHSFCTDPKQTAYPVSVQSGTSASCDKYKDNEIDQHSQSKTYLILSKVVTVIKKKKICVDVHKQKEHVVFIFMIYS